ncbi:MerR family DNA-binding transcriptional regulator [Lactobacillus delbrueckii]
MRRWEKKGLITPMRTAGNRRRYTANFPGFYNSSRISFMHDFPEMRGSLL